MTSLSRLLFAILLLAAPLAAQADEGELPIKEVRDGADAGRLADPVEGDDEPPLGS